jgi:hypothetical protein
MVRDRGRWGNARGAVHACGAIGIAGFAFATLGLFFLPRLTVARTFAPTHAAALATAVRMPGLPFADFLGFTARFFDVFAFGALERAFAAPALRFDFAIARSSHGPATGD